MWPIQLHSLSLLYVGHSSPSWLLAKLRFLNDRTNWFFPSFAAPHFKTFQVFLVYFPKCMACDSSVGVATRYWLDGPGIEFRWGARFSAPFQTGPWAQPTFYTIGTGSFPGVKRPRRGVNHPPASSADVKERVELYSTPHLDLRGLF